MKTVVIALHGFLGEPSDWNAPFALLKNTDRVAFNYTQTNGFGPDVPLKEWGNRFNQYFSKAFPNERRVLVGYSLGGRLALHAIKDNPELWAQTILLSTNPGLMFSPEKAGRLNNDKQWAEKFLKNPWQDVLKEWNEQEVFHGAKEPLREEKKFNRQILADILTNWSLGHQDDFRPWIQKSNAKITWMTGSLDKKYTAMLNSLQVGPQQKKVVMPQAGHRLLFENLSLINFI